MEHTNPTPNTQHSKLVTVIGYGNDLRGDDGIGPRVAALAGMILPDVQAIATRQLTPELAEELARANLAIFVDARPVLREAVEAITLHPLVPTTDSATLGHTSDPRALLGLAMAIYGHAPPAWLLTVPAIAFELGAPLSPVAEQGVRAALRQVVELLMQSRSG
jgi:hydrogenase maturation protease